MKASVFMSVIRSINHLFNSYLSWIVLLMAVLAYMLPAVFSWMTPYIAYMLQFVMFAMGLTLTAQVFIDVFKQPMKVILVSVIQFLWMPLAGFLVALAFNFPPEVGITDTRITFIGCLNTSIKEGHYIRSSTTRTCT